MAYAFQRATVELQVRAARRSRARQYVTFSVMSKSLCVTPVELDFVSVMPALEMPPSDREPKPPEDRKDAGKRAAVALPPLPSAAVPDSAGECAVSESTMLEARNLNIAGR